MLLASFFTSSATEFWNAFYKYRYLKDFYYIQSFMRARFEPRLRRRECDARGKKEAGRGGRCACPAKGGISETRGEQRRRRRGSRRFGRGRGAGRSMSHIPSMPAHNLTDMERRGNSRALAADDRGRSLPAVATCSAVARHRRQASLLCPRSRSEQEFNRLGRGSEAEIEKMGAAQSRG